MHFKSLLATTAVLLAAASALPAVAADGHGHDHRHAARHGGQFVEVGEIGLELVARADSLTVHVIDHDHPLPTAAATGSATVHAGSGKTTVALEPDGENRMVATGSFKTGLGVRVAVALNLPGQPPVKANFRLR